METEVKVGDVVALKSGGPVMTVGFVYSAQSLKHGQVNCVWFDDKDKMRTADFYRLTLKAVDMEKIDSFYEKVGDYSL